LEKIDGALKNDLIKMRSKKRKNGVSLMSYGLLNFAGFLLFIQSIFVHIDQINLRNHSCKQSPDYNYTL